LSEASRAASARAGKGRVGTVVNGVWRIDERIGSGGMATVYAATHRDGRRAALKILHAPLSRDRDVCARFLREAYAANTIAHPGIVAVLDDDVAEDGSAFLVLELLEGETLETRRLGAGGSLPVEEVVVVVERALEALAAAHEKGIVHRDVKPENLFLTNDGRVKLLDFGLAQMKDAQRDSTKTGVTIGTPEFMPPEQARGRGERVDARSDVWGVGATLFTSITGEYVHSANTLREQLLAAATQRARPIRSLAPHVSLALAHVIDRALELEKEDRWPSAVEMKIALERAMSGARDSVTMLAMSPPSGVPSLGASLVPSSSDPTIALSSPSPSSDEPTLHRPLAPAASPTVPDLGDRPAPPSSAPMTPSPATARISASLGRQMAGGGTLLMSGTPTSTPAVRTNEHPKSPRAMPISGSDPASTTIALTPRGSPVAPPSGYAPTTPRMLPQAPPAPTLAPPAPTPAVETPPPRSSARAVVVVTLLVIVVVGAVGGWLLFRSMHR
jgi:serine/threonine-protein kinase